MQTMNDFPLCPQCGAGLRIWPLRRGFLRQCAGCGFQHAGDDDMPGAVSLGEPAPERSALALRAIEAGQPWKMKNIAIAAAQGDSGDVAELSRRLSFERRGA